MDLQRGAFCATLILMATTACVNPGEHLTLRAANKDLQRQLEDLGRYQLELEAENAKLQEVVHDVGRKVADAEFVQGQKKKLERLIKQFQDGGNNQIPGVQVFRSREGDVGFRVQGNVLFSSGKAEVTKSGAEALKSLIPTLIEHGKSIRIAGHTDTDKIKHSPWKTNWRLSSERGMAVLDFLTKNGIDPQQCVVAAYGEYAPLVEEDSPEAKSQNRRVEILLIEG